MQTSLAQKSLVSSHEICTFSTCFKSIPSKNTKDGFSRIRGKTIFVFTPSMEIRGVTCSGCVRTEYQSLVELRDL